MNEKLDERRNLANAKDAAGGTGGGLGPLLSQLREHATALPERERGVALEHVDKLHGESLMKAADTVRMRVWLKGLETFPSLAPIIAQLLEALSNVGA